MDAQVVFTFDVDVDSVWVGEDPAAAAKPVTLSHGLYEVRRGLRLVLDTLAETEVRATFFVPGVVASEHPGVVEAILEGGHEVGHHGHTHRAPAQLSADEEREEFVRSITALQAFGVDPGGYRAPSWDLSDRTLEMVSEFGFSYSANFMDDVFPYRHANGVVELPGHWNLDDAAHMWFAGDDTWLRKISTNSEVNEIFDAELDGITAIGGTCVYTFHPQFVGRPGRLPVLRHAIERSRVRVGDAILTAGAVAAKWNAARVQ
jgi:peptidoglycan/xylan/chitin deacetylase (PgdA/CDA1 family)